MLLNPIINRCGNRLILRTYCCENFHLQLLWLTRGSLSSLHDKHNYFNIIYLAHTHSHVFKSFSQQWLPSSRLKCLSPNYFPILYCQQPWVLDRKINCSLTGNQTALNNRTHKQMMFSSVITFSITFLIWLKKTSVAWYPKWNTACGHKQSRIFPMKLLKSG